MKNYKIDIESLKRENIHRVPEGYFDGLPLKIQSKIGEQNTVHVSSFTFRMQLLTGMTAALVIFFIGWFGYQQVDNTISVDQMLSDIDSEHLIEYLYEENISTNDLLAVIEEEYLLEDMSAIESNLIDANLSTDDLESIYSEMDYSIDAL